MEKVILIQIRQDKNIANQELRIFKKYFEKAKIDFEKINVCHEHFDLDRALKFFDAVIVGGSDFSVKDNFPQKENVKKFIIKSVAGNKSFLGICFGFQLLVYFLGGKVIKNKKSQEFGTNEILLNRFDAKDKIFYKISKKLLVQEGHSWMASLVPKNADIIAKGINVAIQGVKIKNKNVYGFQFHPELGKKEMLERMQYYNSIKNSHYNFLDADFNKVRESKMADQIIYNFLKYY